MITHPEKVLFPDDGITKGELAAYYGYSATFAAVYSVRPKPGAPVSAPCRWEELECGELGPRTFTLRTMAARIAAVGDLWAEMYQRKCSLRPAMERLRSD